MPKIVDHEQRRDEIALVACRVVADYGFDQATVGCGARRLILRRIDERLTRAAGQATPDLLLLLTEALPVDEQRYTECAFWIAFWGQVSADKRLKRINAWVHREYMRLFERCLEQGWEQWPQWPLAPREPVLRS